MSKTRPIHKVANLLTRSNDNRSVTFNKCVTSKVDELDSWCSVYMYIYEYLWNTVLATSYSVFPYSKSKQLIVIKNIHKPTTKRESTVLLPVILFLVSILSKIYVQDHFVFLLLHNNICHFSQGRKYTW